MEGFEREQASNPRVLRSLAPPGSLPESAHKETVQQVMLEARLVLAGRREFRSLLRALRG